MASAETKYCRYCGNQIPAVARYCPVCGTDQERFISPVLEKGGRGCVARPNSRLYLMLFVACFAILIAGVYAGSQATLSRSDAEAIVGGVVDNFGSGPAVLRIALNNIMVCIRFFIPVFGTIFMALVSYNTGLVISAAAVLTPSATPTGVFFTVLVSPWTPFEFIAYSLASSQGISILIGAFTGRFRLELRRTVTILGISVALLAIGAVIEGYFLSSI